MQEASLGQSESGLRQTHGLVGSGEWWAHVADGSLPVHTASGTVIHFCPGHHGDWPEFEMREGDGTSSNWGCFIPAADAARHFLLGNRVEVDYVHQELKVAFNGSPRTCVVVAIRVGLKASDGFPVVPTR
jgi:hypothetical protein